MNDVPQGRKHFPLIAISVLITVCLLSLHLPRAASAQDAKTSKAPIGKPLLPTRIPVELVQYVEQALEAVNARDARRLAPFVADDARDAYNWINETTTRKWSVGVAVIPPTEANPEPGYLAVFHAWHTCESDGDHVHKVQHTAQGWRLGSEIPETETGGFLVRDHDLHVEVEPSRKSAHFSDNVRIERTVETLPAFCLLRLSDELHVTQFSVDKTNTQFQQAGGVLVFAPPQAKTFTVQLKYEGVIDHKGSDYIRDDEATINSYWYPNIARLPATTTVTAKSPPGWLALAQGELKEDIPNRDGGHTVVYRNDIPNSFFTVDMGRYHVTSRKIGDQTLYAYLLRDDQKFANRCLDLLEKALAFYDSHFAPFPYTRYTLVETRGPFAGALEAYSFATFQAGTLPGTIAHELSHTWWGGIVPCTYTRSMWNESFAEYSDTLFQRQTVRATGLPAERPRFGHAFDSYTAAGAHDTSDNKQNSVGYGKGALVMRVLEDEIGLDMMLRSLQTFVRDHPKGTAAEWPEFEKVVNTVTKNDYSWFFNEWIQRTGLPSIHLTHVTARKDGAEYIVEGDIEQTDNPYRLHVNELLETVAGENVKGATETVGATTHFILHTRSAPTRLTLDPRHILPLGDPGASATVYNFPNGQ